MDAGAAASGARSRGHPPDPGSWLSAGTRVVTSAADPRPRATLRDLTRRDAAWAAGVVAILLVGPWLRFGDAPNPVRVGLAALAGGLILVRRVRPAGVLVATSLLAAAWIAAGHRGIVVAIVVVLALANAAELCRPTVSLPLAALVVAGVHGLTAARGSGSLLSLANFRDVAWFTSATAAGLVMRARRVELAAIEQREADRRAAETERRLAEERDRIARELHDSVGHAVATVSMQADVAARVIDSQPEEAARALRAIAEISRRTLREIRGTLGLLRSAAGEGPVDRDPVPTLDAVDGLFDVLRGRGVEVEVTLGGDLEDVPAAVARALYRVAQEAATNVAKHARGARHVEVVLEAREGATILVVRDDGGAPAGAPEGAPPGGHGLRNMRERARAFGGTVSARRRPGGGFEVLAVAPTGDAHRTGGRRDRRVRTPGAAER